MQEIQDEMRENQGKLLTLAKVRAIQRQAKMPQNLLSTELQPSTKRGGGVAGLARVVGAGKKKRCASPESVSSMESGEGGARHMGRMMYQHLAKLHGEKYAKKFMGGAAPRGPMPPSGIEVGHAYMSPATVGLPGQALGGQDVPPGGMAPMAYGSVPQAPASFQRNSVSIGSQGLLPSAQTGNGRYKKKHSTPSVHHTMNEMEGGVVVGRPGRGVYQGVGTSSAPVTGGARAMRGAAIKRIMKEHGLNLGQASKYLKEHPDA